MVENLKLDKKSLQYLGIIVIIAIIVCIGFFYYLKKTEIKEVLEQEPSEKTMEEILESLGIPGREGREVPKEVLESLGVPGREGREASEEVLESLGTVPE